MASVKTNRVGLEDSMLTTLVKMSDGNPGALSVMSGLLEKVPQIDPQCALGGLMVILCFDDMGIYGSDIWLLYKDVCDSDFVRLIGLLRGRQLGFCSEGDIKAAIHKANNRQSQVLDINKILKEVRAELPTFDEQRESVENPHEN